MIDRTSDVLMLHSMVVDALRDINAPAPAGMIGDAAAQTRNKKLGSTIADLARIPTIPGTHAHRAKAEACRRYFIAVHCDGLGCLPEDTDLSLQLVWSLLNDATRRAA